jgi:integrase
MARRAVDYPITSKTSRAKLEAREKPYYRQLAPRVTLGYLRRSSGPGSWVRRENVGPGRFLTRVIATADDLALPDGKRVLSYEQAVKAAGAPRTKPVEPLTVKAALEAYITALAARSKHARDARQRSHKHIYPTLGTKRVDALTRTDVETWRNALVVDREDDPDAKRRSQDSANRLLTILKAGLNHAFSEEANGITSDKAWRSVEAFRDTTGTREYHFTPEETVKLIDSARKVDRAFADLCEAGFLTGARYGELAALDVRHFDARQGSLQVPFGKTGSRIVSLTAESVAFFAALA